MARYKKGTTIPLTHVPLCPNSEHVVSILRKLDERDIMGRRDVECPACGQTVKCVMITGSAEQPTPTGHYYVEHYAEAVT